MGEENHPRRVAGEASLELQAAGRARQRIAELELLASGVERPPEAKLSARAFEALGKRAGRRGEVAGRGRDLGAEERLPPGALRFSQVDHPVRRVVQLVGLVHLQLLAAAIDAQGGIAAARDGGVCVDRRDPQLDLELLLAHGEADPRAEGDFVHARAHQVDRVRVGGDAGEDEAPPVVRDAARDAGLAGFADGVEHDGEARPGPALPHDASADRALALGVRRLRGRGASRQRGGEGEPV
jgi:hypothetical protein